MSYVLTCPNCGVREVTDFAFGGELNPRPKQAPSLRELGEYNYFRRNVAGVQQEWWLHRSGCGEWFIAERDTRTNDVHWTRPRARGVRSPREIRPPRDAASPSSAASASTVTRRSRSRSTAARSPASRATRSGRRCSPAGSARSRAPSSTTAAAASSAAPGSAPTASSSVDGAPGVRACTEPVREGMRVEHMNASPSLEFDVMRTTDLVGGPFTPPGFYYKTFIRPRRFWPLYEKFLRHAAGLGKLRKCAARARVAHRVPPTSRRRPRDRGWGRRPERGGGGGGARCRRGARRRGPGAGRAAARRGRRGVRARAGRAGAQRRASRSSPTRRRSGMFDGLVPVWEGDTLHQIRAQRMVFATGAIEQPLLFPGNDLPGRDAVRRRTPAGGHVRGAAGHARGGGDGRRPRPPRGACAARRRRGDRLRGRPARAHVRRPGGRAPARERAADVRASTVLEARGRNESAQRRDREAGLGRPSRRSPATCSVVSGGSAPATSLVAQAGGKTAYDESRGHFALAEIPDGALRGGRAQGQGRPRVRPALGNDRGRRGGPRARLRRRGLPRPRSPASARVMSRTRCRRRSPCRRP